MWNGLPVIRRELAESMITNFGLNQKQTAQKLGVTPAAVCQYISKKRGKFLIQDPDIHNEIKKSAETIINADEEVVLTETCRICKILTQKGVFPLECPSCSDK